VASNPPGILKTPIFSILPEKLHEVTPFFYQARRQTGSHYGNKLPVGAMMKKKMRSREEESTTKEKEDAGGTE